MLAVLGTIGREQFVHPDVYRCPRFPKPFLAIRIVLCERSHTDDNGIKIAIVLHVSQLADRVAEVAAESTLLAFLGSDFRCLFSQFSIPFTLCDLGLAFAIERRAVSVAL